MKLLTRSSCIGSRAAHLKKPSFTIGWKVKASLCSESEMSWRAQRLLQEFLASEAEPPLAWLVGGGVVHMIKEPDSSLLAQLLNEPLHLVTFFRRLGLRIHGVEAARKTRIAGNVKLLDSERLHFFKTLVLRRALKCRRKRKLFNTTHPNITTK